MAVGINVERILLIASILLFLVPALRCLVQGRA
jgi:hypothetical protein